MAQASIHKHASNRTSKGWSLWSATLGGKQFWTDHFLYQRWRIQKHFKSEQFRLLDKFGCRRAVGSFQDCLESLKSCDRDLNGEANQTNAASNSKYLIVLHGLIRTRYSMRRICRFIERNSELTVLNVSYASSRNSISEHAAALKKIIQGLESAEQISFVCHSLGNIVVRHFLGDLRREANPEIDPKIFRRMVMLAPPNQGSQFAAKFHNWFAFRKIFGKSGMELGKDWQKTSERLASPDFEFGIIAGGQEKRFSLKNPMLKGMDDLVVTVDETQLETAKELAVRPLHHTTIMNDRWVHQATLNFLLYGKFENTNEGDRD